MALKQQRFLRDFRSNEETLMREYASRCDNLLRKKGLTYNPATERGWLIQVIPNGRKIQLFACEYDSE
jgi:hypothetical protein